MSATTLSIEESLRYARQMKLPQVGEAGQIQLKNARVLFVGAGGLGAPALLYLVAAGVGTVGIVDDDEVSLSNLHRQILYHTADIGQRKVEAAKAHLLALNPSVEIHTYSEKITAVNVARLVGQYDLIVDGSDQFYTRYLIHDHCFALKKPYFYASVSQFQGHNAIFDGSPCLRCVFPTPPARHLAPNCSEAGVLGVLPGLLGMMQATEVLKWILKIGETLEQRLLIVDILTLKFQEIALVKNPDCPLCVHHETFDADASMQCEQASAVISAAAFVTLLQQEPSLVLIDVRTPTEHAEQNVGGLLIPLAELPDRLHELDPQRLTVLYCRSGQRSLHAVEILQQAGFRAVRSVEGGCAALAAFGINGQFDIKAV